MAGKKKDKSKKKGKSKGDAPHIAQCLMPPCMFVAVPRTPLPTTVPPDFGQSFNSSLPSSHKSHNTSNIETPIERPRAITPPDCEADTDTSLYDYAVTDRKVQWGTGSGRPNKLSTQEEIPNKKARVQHSLIEKARSDGQTPTAVEGRNQYSDWDSEEESNNNIGKPNSAADLDFDPNYASVEYRDGETRALSPPHHEHSYDRNRLPSPSLDDGLMDEVDSEFLVQSSRTPSPHNVPGSSFYESEQARPSSPLYAEVQKPRAKKATSNGSDLTHVSSLHEDLASPLPTSNHEGFGEDEDHTQPVLPSRPHTPSPRFYSTIERMNETQTLTRSESRSSKKLTFTAEDLSHTTSPKLLELERQNAALMRQQVVLQEQLQAQQQQQLEILQRLQEEAMASSGPQPDATATTTQDMGSLLHETQSVTEGTLQQQQELIASYHERTTVLEQEKKEMQDLNEQLQAEIIALRRMALYKDSEEPAGTQTVLLKKQLKAYKEERETLQKTITELSAELSRYQSKYRPPDKEGSEMGLPTRGPKPSWLINTKYLAPLFIAYDDRLHEKDQVIQKYDSELESFRGRIEEIIKENQRLHLRLEQSDVSGPVSMTEWKQLQEQCKLVLEENQLLMEQLDIQQTKVKDMHAAHVQEVTKLSKRLVHMEADMKESQRQAEEAADALTEMKKKHSTAVIENKSRVSVEDYTSAIAELKRSVEDEKLKHSHELENMKTKQQTLEADKKILTVELDDARAENRQLQNELKSVTKTYRKNHKKVLVLQKVVDDLENHEHSASHYLSSVVKVAEQTALERDTFAQVVQTQGQQNKKAMNKLLAENITVGRMEEKLKLVKLKASEKLEKAVQRLKQQDNDFNQQRAEYERELKHLRLLLREKDEMLAGLTGEKRKIEDDLEIVWQSASADNRRMRETLRKSVRKLREHATLQAVLSDDEKDDLLLSDDD